MKKAILICAVVGCGSPESEYVDATFRPGIDRNFETDERPSIFVPGQEGRIDGSVWQDGLFNTPEAKADFCSGEHGDAWFCNSEPASEVDKAWASAEYHGLAIGAQTCYGPAQTGNGTGDCLFPQLKQLRFSIDLSTNNCGNPISQENEKIIFGVIDGMMMWDGIGGVEVEDSGTAPSWYMKVDVACDASLTAYALGGLSGTVSVRVSDAPVGPHSGKDVDDLRVINGGTLTIGTTTTKNNCRNFCNAGAVACTPAQLQTFSRATGAHEAGHVLGFGHFSGGGSMNSNVMYPFRASACAQATSISGTYSNAIGIFNSSANLGSVTDQNLENHTPL